MSSTEKTPEEIQAEATAAAEAATAAAAATVAAEAAAAAAKEELSAEALRTLLTNANAEAANYRVKAREAQEALAKAKTPEEFEAAKAEFTAKITELERTVLVSKVARDHELPADLAGVLSGATEAELVAHAKVLQKYVGKEAPGHLEGGLDPKDELLDSDDPRALAGAYGPRRKR